MGVLDELEQSLNIPPLQFSSTNIQNIKLEEYENDVEVGMGESTDVETPTSSQCHEDELSMSKQQFYETYKQYLETNTPSNSMYDYKHRMKGEQITNYLNELIQRGGI